MTLIEVIISILVFGVAGAIMVVTGTTTKKLMMNTNHLNNKFNAEAPITAAQDVNTLDKAYDDKGITEMPTEEVVIKVKVDAQEHDAKLVKYDTSGMIDATSPFTNTNMNGNLQFYEILPTETVGP